MILLIYQRSNLSLSLIRKGSFLNDRKRVFKISEHKIPPLYRAIVVTVSLPLRFARINLAINVINNHPIKKGPTKKILIAKSKFLMFRILVKG